MPYMSRSYALALLLLVVSLTACDFPNDTLYVGNAQVALPLVTKHWRVERPVKGDKTGAWCIVTAGPNSVAVKLVRGNNGSVRTAEIRSTRSLLPGSTLTARWNDHNYTTSEDVFPPALATPLLQDMRKGGELYLDWREVGRGPAGRNRLASQIDLQEFKDVYAQCEHSLAPSALPKKNKSKARKK